MNTTQHYIEITNEQPTLNKCFFAFSNKQFAEGKIKAGINDGEKIYKSDYGLFGTAEGLEETFQFYENQTKRVAAECNPQDVYDYEWDNHECMISYEDDEVIKIIIHYFGVDVAKTVKRKYGYSDIETLV
ncbi:hypothetical protein LJC25_04295 [Bacteroidales bacterium OttesenSCG-928-K03]|nr:hypothetical protein [Odoribacter sp. OttesenSCG-928-L07]MDL2242931.1 hypothetical protein [Bacteroidales bacterium OttesenSCG-928-K03]